MGMICLLVCCCGCSARPDGVARLPIVRIDTVDLYAQSRTVQFPGCVKAAQEVNLAFKIGGTLQTIFAEEGAFVRCGEPLAALDPRDYRLQLDAVEAEYKRVKAEAERVMALYADGVTTPDAYDKARYGLQQIEAKYENCKNQLADTKIDAPFDGYVQKRLFDPSTVVGAGMPVLTVVSAQAPEIEINIPGSEYVRRGDFDRFEAAFDFWPGKKIPLRLLSISPKANANQLYTLRLGVPADLRPLPSPGMNTMVTIACKPSESAQAVVPAVALFSEGERTCVWIYRPDSTVVSREVTVEQLHTGGEAVVGTGLSAGERIVTSGVHRLREGEKVAPLPAVTKTNVGGLL